MITNKMMSYYILLFLIKYSISLNCFDKNCIECTDEKYGNCTKCDQYYTLIEERN